MKQTIVIARPPVYGRCDKQFGINGKAILFSWGDKIYNPENVDIPHELLAHEAAHGVRQVQIGVGLWWEQYLADENFRFDEELIAHRAEWRDYVRRHPGKNCSEMLEHIAGKLASDLYGNIVSVDVARAAIMARD